MKAQLNLSIEIELAADVKRLKEKGMLPSELFAKLIKEIVKNDDQLPVTIKASEAVI
jgi:hypothetical protein